MTRWRWANLGYPNPCISWEIDSTGQLAGAMWRCLFIPAPTTLPERVPHGSHTLIVAVKGSGAHGESEHWHLGVLSSSTTFLGWWWRGDGERTRQYRKEEAGGDVLLVRYPKSASRPLFETFNRIDFPANNTCSHSYHSSIKISPAHVSPENTPLIFQNLNGATLGCECKYKFVLGGRVRISKLRGVVDKSSFADEVFYNSRTHPTHSTSIQTHRLWWGLLSYTTLNFF